MSKPARLRLAVEGLDEEGAGLGRHQGAATTVHVPFALPGETVLCELEHQSPHRPHAWARLLEVVEAAAERVSPACDAWGRCGGCTLQHLAYPAQLSFKRSQLSAALAAVGLGRVPVEPCRAATGAPRPYRNRAKLVFARAPLPATGGQRVILGAYAPRSHRVVDLAGCRVVIPPLDAVAQTVASLATRLGVRPYDERSGEGDARYLVLRAARDGTTQALLVVARRGGHHVAELAEALCAERPEVLGVVENLQPSRGNALVGTLEPDRRLAGAAPLLHQGVGGSLLQLSPRAFFQAGWDGAELLYRTVVERAELAPGEQAVDLYSGVGGIALALASATPGAQVRGVEEVAEAVADARAASERAGLGEAVRFEAAAVARFLATAPGPPPDLVVVDPPRRGLEEAVIEGLLRWRPRRLVYVSCDAGTLARDLARLALGGYQARSAVPIDLMPDTPHLEAVVRLDPG